MLQNRKTPTARKDIKIGDRVGGTRRDTAHLTGDEPEKSAGKRRQAEGRAGVADSDKALAACRYPRPNTRKREGGAKGQRGKPTAGGPR